MQGEITFHRLREAVKELAKLKTPPATVTTSLNTLVNVTHALAQTALDEAIAAGGTAKLIAKAQKEMTKAQQDLAKNQAANAISHYEEAWEYAQQAVGIPVLAASDDSAPADPEASEDEEPHLHEDESEDDEAALSNQVFLPLVSR